MSGLKVKISDGGLYSQEGLQPFDGPVEFWLDGRCVFSIHQIKNEIGIEVSSNFRWSGMHVFPRATNSIHIFPADPRDAIIKELKP